MINLVALLGSLLTGLFLGGFFFGGLFLTVERGFAVKRPALVFLGSWLARMTVVLGVLYLVAAGRWERLLVCVAGFLIARVVLIRFIRAAAWHSVSIKEARDAPQPR